MANKQELAIKKIRERKREKRRGEREREKNCVVNVAPNTLEVTVGGPQVWYNLDLTDTWMD